MSKTPVLPKDVEQRFDNKFVYTGSGENTNETDARWCLMDGGVNRKEWEMIKEIKQFIAEQIDHAAAQAVEAERERALTIAKGYILNRPVNSPMPLVVPEKLYKELLALNQQMDETDKSFSPTGEAEREKA